MRWALLMAMAGLALATTPNTTIVDVIISPGGGNPSGIATISWGRYLNDATPRQVIYPGSKTITISSGVIRTDLFPNAIALPPAGCYKVAYTLNGVNSIRYWFVPVSATAVTLQQVEGDIPCATQSGAIVAPSQINPGSAGQTLVLTSNPTGLVNWAVGGGGGGGSAIITLTITAASFGTFQTIQPGSFLGCQDPNTFADVRPLSPGDPTSANPTVTFSTAVTVKCFGLASGASIVILPFVNASVNTFSNIKPGSFMRCQDSTTNTLLTPLSPGDPTSTSPTVTFSTPVNANCYALSQ